jgi:phage gp36-like protein
MGYCTKDDLLLTMSEENLILITDVEQTDELNAAVLARAIDDATAEVNYYLAGKIELPFSTVPDIIRKFTVIITTYNLSVTSRAGAKEDQKLRFEQVMGKLNDVKTGKTTLSALDPTGAIIGTSTQRITYHTDSIRVFTEDSLKYY